MPENLQESLSGLGKKKGRLHALLCSPNTPSLLTATLLPNMAPHTQIHGVSRCPLLCISFNQHPSNIPPRLSLLHVLCFDHKSRMNSCQHLFLPGNLSFWICSQHYDRRHHNNRKMWFCVCSGLNLLLARHFLNYLLTSNPFFITYLLLWTSSSLQPVLTRNEDSSPMAHVGMAALGYTSHGHSTPHSQLHPLSTLRLLFHSCHPSLQLHSHRPSSVPSLSMQDHSDHFLLLKEPLSFSIKNNSAHTTWGRDVPDQFSLQHPTLSTQICALSTLIQFKDKV